MDKAQIKGKFWGYSFFGETSPPLLTPRPRPHFSWHGGLNPGQLPCSLARLRWKAALLDEPAGTSRKSRATIPLRESSVHATAHDPPIPPRRTKNGSRSKRRRAVGSARDAERCGHEHIEVRGTEYRGRIRLADCQEPFRRL